MRSAPFRHPGGRRERSASVHPYAHRIPRPRRRKRRDRVDASALQFELEPDPVLERDRPLDPGPQRPGRVEPHVRGPGEQDGAGVLEDPSNPRKRATSAVGGASSSSRGGPDGGERGRRSARAGGRRAPTPRPGRGRRRASPASSSAAPRRRRRAGWRAPPRRGRRTARRAAGRPGATAIARARWTRRRSPPDSSAPRRSARWPAPIAASAAARAVVALRARHAPPGERRASTLASTLRRARSGDCRATATRPRRSTVPAAAGSTPASASSSVLLPGAVGPEQRDDLPGPRARGSTSRTTSPLAAAHRQLAAAASSGVRAAAGHVGGRKRSPMPPSRCWSTVSAAEQDEDQREQDDADRHGVRRSWPSVDLLRARRSRASGRSPRCCRRR